MIINSRADLEAMRGAPDFAAALRHLLGATTTWVNHGTAEAPDWEEISDLSYIEALEFTQQEFLDECAAVGMAPQQPAPPAAAATPTVEQLLAYAANKRWQIETGGFVFSGMTIATDRDSQVKIAGAWAKAANDPAFTVLDWKLAPGVFVAALDNATILAIGDAVTAHVQGCFTKEREISEAILADPPTITTVAEIDTAFDT